MTIDWTRKRKLPRFAVLSLRAFGLAALAAVLFIDLQLLHSGWHHFTLVERDRWIADHARLKTLIETQYPNLDWVVSRGGLDLNRLDARTTHLLENAETAEDAERVLRDFVRAFHDGHMSLRSGDEPIGRVRREDVTLSGSTPGKTACEALGYVEDDGRELELEFRGPSQFRPLPGDGPFAAGLLQMDGRKVGILRIRSFDPGDYAETCASEWDRVRVALSTTCESDCADAFEDAVISRLIDELGIRIRQVAESGAGTLVVDVRGNGGGYRAFGAAAAELLAGRPVPDPGRAIIIGEGTISSFEWQRRQLERALDLCTSESEARRDLEAAYWRVDRAAADSAIPCDRSAVWSEWGARPGCDGLVRFETFDDGTLAELSQVSLPRRDPRPGPLRSIPSRPRWRGRLAILTNRNTGSAAEILAGSLQDYAGAVVIGQRSNGSGGGWVLGRRYWFLEHSGLRLVMPDHVGYRRDETSYHAGVTPDIPAAFDPRNDDGYKARALVAGLRAMGTHDEGDGAVTQGQNDE